MPKFTLTIECENAAFDDCEAEIARILRDVADRVESGAADSDKHRNLYDSNGNVVGTFVLAD
jgi:cytochrome c-type biogenesis protein CcmH/NrfF